MGNWKKVVFTAGVLFFTLTGCQSASASNVITAGAGETVKEESVSETEAHEQTETELAETAADMETSENENQEALHTGKTIRVQNGDYTILFELNDSQAARDLYEQLPLTLDNKDFSNNEKTFYPPKKLSVSETPHSDGKAGTLSYYEPWGDVVLFYGDCNPNDQLYELGKVISGAEWISEISGSITVSAE